MKKIVIALLTIAFAGVAVAQQQPGASSASHAGAGATTLSDSSNLPAERIGPNDLVGITVYDSPELTRTVRVDSDGTIRLPMLKQHVQAAGLYPEELEKAITNALVNGQVLVDPVVTVSVVEYRSRPVNVVGAVRTPVTLQAVGNVTLLDAISQAGGLADNAGQDILISRQQPTADGKSTTLIQRIPVRGLLDAVDPSLNVSLHGGEVVRVPEAGQYYVVGNVKAPGAYPIKAGSEATIFTALALTQGLSPFAAHRAYIFRTEAGSGGKSQIPVELKKILDRKSPDVPLMANDVLYIPEATGRKTARNVFYVVGTAGMAIGMSLLYIYH